MEREREREGGGEQAKDGERERESRRDEMYNRLKVLQPHAHVYRFLHKIIYKTIYKQKEQNKKKCFAKLSTYVSIVLTLCLCDFFHVSLIILCEAYKTQGTSEKRKHLILQLSKQNDTQEKCLED